MLKPPRPSYSELVTQLQNLDQRRSWFSNHIDVPTSSTPQTAFYGQQQQRFQQPSSGYVAINKNLHPLEEDFRHNNVEKKNHAYSDNPTSPSQQRRPPPPGARHMTPAKRDLYKHASIVARWVILPKYVGGFPRSQLNLMTFHKLLRPSPWTTPSPKQNGPQTWEPPTT